MEDISFKKFGLTLRAVTERDAQTIVAWRTDEQRRRFISATDADVVKQKEWIRAYKLRESEGKEYYFMVEDSTGQAFGTTRIYWSSEEYIEAGSWVSKPGYSKGWNVFKILLITRSFILDTLSLDKFIFRIHQDNAPVIKMCRVFSEQNYKVEGLYLYYLVEKNYTSPDLARLYQRFDIS